jgi:hypothetical protein
MSMTRYAQHPDRPDHFDPTRFTHLHDCMCPTCHDEGERPDFLALAHRDYTAAHRDIAYAVTESCGDHLVAETARVVVGMHARLSRYLACDVVWDFPDHFTLDTSHAGNSVQPVAGYSLLVLTAIRDSRRRVVARSDVGIYAAVSHGGRTTTDLDAMRRDPDNPNSPVVVGHLREWFDLDQTVGTN